MSPASAAFATAGLRGIFDVFRLPLRARDRKPQRKAHVRCGHPIPCRNGRLILRARYAPIISGTLPTRGWLRGGAAHLPLRHRNGDRRWRLHTSVMSFISWPRLLSGRRIVDYIVLNEVQNLIKRSRRRGRLPVMHLIRCFLFELPAFGIKRQRPLRRGRSRVIELDIRNDSQRPKCLSFSLPWPVSD